MDCKKRFSENLKKHMWRLNISQKDLKEKLNISKSIVSDWYNGKAFPRSEKLDELCKILDVDIVELFIDKDDNIVLFNEIDSNAINEFIEFTSTVNYEEIQFVYPKYYGESPDLDKIAGINIAVSTELLREDKSIFERFNKLKNKLTDYNVNFHKL